MIGLEELTAGIAGYLREKGGLAATNERAESPVYPCLVVEAESKTVGLIACGKQVERQVTVRVICYPSRRRERSAGLSLADRVYGLLAGGFTACGRGFCPGEVSVTVDGQQRPVVTAEIAFCDLPEGTQPETAVTERMGSLSLRMCHSKEEE